MGKDGIDDRQSFCMYVTVKRCLCFEKYLRAEDCIEW